MIKQRNNSQKNITGKNKKRKLGSINIQIQNENLKKNSEYVREEETEESIHDFNDNNNSILMQKDQNKTVHFEANKMN